MNHKAEKRMDRNNNWVASIQQIRPSTVHDQNKIVIENIN